MRFFAMIMALKSLKITQKSLKIPRNNSKNSPQYQIHNKNHKI
jgi:hypothetical protein